MVSEMKRTKINVILSFYMCMYLCVYLKIPFCSFIVSLTISKIILRVHTSKILNFYLKSDFNGVSFITFLRNFFLYFSNRFYRYNRCWSIPIFSKIGANRGNRNLFLLKFLYTSDGRYLSLSLQF